MSYYATRKWTILVIALLIGPLLSACAARGGCVIPQQLIEPAPMPQLGGKMCSDMTRWAIELQGWGASCETDKGAIRALTND